MRFKKIYVEITNSCNLDCPFCIRNSRKITFITKEKFSILLDKIKPYTDYIYLHVLGEPLLHPNINELINIASSKNIRVNLTTNGYLIDNLRTKVRQVNVSLHSFNKDKNLSLETYLYNILNKTKEYPDTYFSLRLWIHNENTSDIIKFLSNYYHIELDSHNLENKKLDDNVYLNIDSEFIWPDLNNNYYNEEGKCYGLIDHIGILVDGTIVPCCLDSKGIINLGNIYQDNLDNILVTKRVIKMIKGFKNNKKCEELCKHCKYL